MVVEFLKRGGIEASYSEPPGWFAPFSEGDYDGVLFGHGGSCREPQETLSLYQSSSEAIPGGHAVNFSKWSNPEFDALADEAFVTSPTDTEKLIDIWRRADGNLAARTARYPAHARLPSSAVDRTELARHAGREQSVHEFGPVASHLPTGAAPCSACTGIGRTRTAAPHGAAVPSPSGPAVQR